MRPDFQKAERPSLQARAFEVIGFEQGLGHEVSTHWDALRARWRTFAVRIRWHWYRSGAWRQEVLA